MQGGSQGRRTAAAMPAAAAGGRTAAAAPGCACRSAAAGCGSSRPPCRSGGPPAPPARPGPPWGPARGRVWGRDGGGRSAAAARPWTAASAAAAAVGGGGRGAALGAQDPRPRTPGLPARWPAGSAAPLAPAAAPSRPGAPASRSPADARFFSGPPSSASSSSRPRLLLGCGRGKKRACGGRQVAPTAVGAAGPTGELGAAMPRDQRTAAPRAGQNRVAEREAPPATQGGHRTAPQGSFPHLGSGHQLGGHGLGLRHGRSGVNGGRGPRPLLLGARAAASSVLTGRWRGCRLGGARGLAIGGGRRGRRRLGRLLALWLQLGLVRHGCRVVGRLEGGTAWVQVGWQQHSRQQVERQLAGCARTPAVLARHRDRALQPSRASDHFPRRAPSCPCPYELRGPAALARAASTSAGRPQRPPGGARTPEARSRHGQLAPPPAPPPLGARRRRRWAAAARACCLAPLPAPHTILTTQTVHSPSRSAPATAAGAAGLTTRPGAAAAARAGSVGRPPWTAARCRTTTRSPPSSARTATWCGWAARRATRCRPRRGGAPGAAAASTRCPRPRSRCGRGRARRAASKQRGSLLPPSFACLWRRRGDALPAPAPAPATLQGLCIGSLFSICATNGVDAARRLHLLGFCQSTEQLYERVEECVLRRGGEVWETRRQLSRRARALGGVAGGAGVGHAACRWPLPAAAGSAGAGSLDTSSGCRLLANHPASSPESPALLSLTP